MTEPLNIVVLGLSITSSWGNGHATTFRSLLHGLHQLGHSPLFLERDLPWYADNRDAPVLDFARVELYRDLPDLKRRFGRQVREADVVIVGSYVPDGVEVGRWVTRVARGLTAFYDIDTPVTLAELAAQRETYIARTLIPRFHLYLSFTGGGVLELIERTFGAQRARVLYCAVDVTRYYPEPTPQRWDLAYLGTYSDDRQLSIDELLLAVAREEPERNFAVVGPQYPEHIEWPPNVERDEHLAPGEHRAFYNAQRFTLNVTRQHMRALGYSPSVRLFEAAACGVPIISDVWPGIETIFVPEREILLARGQRDVRTYLNELSEGERSSIAAAARRRILDSHTGLQRARELLCYLREVRMDSLVTTGVEA